MLIREFAPADAGATAACYRAGRAHILLTPQVALRSWARARPGQHYRVLLAESDGVVVGVARCQVNDGTSTPGQGMIGLAVLPEHRGRGAGTALAAAAERALRAVGATHLHAWADGDAVSVGFAERRGYRAGRTGRFARLDLTGPLPPLPPVPPGVELRTAADYLDDPRPVYRLDRAAGLDEPGELPTDDLGYSDWFESVWQLPDQRHELTVVAVADGRPVAFSAVRAAGTRYWSAFTGTLPEYRGRGLAKLVKAASLHRARAAGLTEAFTDNDSTNAAVLAVNAWCGYELWATERKMIKEL
ncbi:GNAT family N-acetyltransferase [Kitasatospora sp. NPDC058965]|uniref:GNAT family N-acetyltransferase n=1 Tax=Kitasatospora sp. NPDC058965 TaxID=3346682 RepID=UPI003688E555